MIDPANCGSCNNTCPTDCLGQQRCSGGTCIYPQSTQVYIDDQYGCGAGYSPQLAFNFADALTCAKKNLATGYNAGTFGGYFSNYVLCPDGASFTCNEPAYPAITADDAKKCTQHRYSNCTIVSRDQYVAAGCIPSP
jgi:hypothetical protein